MAFSIKELETISGIKAHTIRIWEQRYHFLKPARTVTNIRTYSNEELKTLLTVALLNKYGYKISRIDSMLPEQRHQALLQLQDAEAKHEYLVNELIGCMIDLRAHQFEVLLNNYIQTKGIEQAITTLIFLFLEKVGILWQTGRINPAQEHIVSNIIRQKIISGIEALPLPERTRPLFLLFLPEDEFHEMGLLFVFYLLRKKNIPVLYLGASVPLKDVLFVAEQRQPQYVYLHLTALPRHTRLERLLQPLTGQTTARVLLSGHPAQSFRAALLPSVHLFQSLPEVLAYINQL